MKRMLKKLLFVALLAASLLSCTKENPNPLSNTSWSYVSFLLKDTHHIKFMDDTYVAIWRNNEGKYLGTYTIKGDKVTFHNLRDSEMEYQYISAILTTPNSLEVKRYSDFSESYLTITYIKD